MIRADVFGASVALVRVGQAGSVGVAYAVAFGLSAGAVMFNPAAGSLLPDIVSDDEVVAANSAMWTAAVTGQIALAPIAGFVRSEEHTSELQSLMRISYAVFCLKKKITDVTRRHCNG